MATEVVGLFGIPTLLLCVATYIGVPALTQTTDCQWLFPGLFVEVIVFLPLLSLFCVLLA